MLERRWQKTRVTHLRGPLMRMFHRPLRNRPGSPGRVLTALAMLLGLAWLAGGGSTALAAQPLRLKLTVKAGQYDRQNTPISVPITVPADLAKVTSATLVDEQGNRLPGQVTEPSLLDQRGDDAQGGTARTLHFVLPRLKAGQQTTLVAAIPGETAETATRWNHADKQYAELVAGERPVLRYMCAPLDPKKREQTYKVFHHLYDPTGQQLVTKGPGGRFTHHRGLFYGFNRVSYGDGKHNVDVWHCSRDAHQSHDGFLAEEAGPVLGRHLLAVGWHGDEGKTFAEETRELTAYLVPQGQLIEFASRLQTKVGPIKLDGDPQHAGFHFRASNEVADSTAKQTYYLRPDGKGALGATRNWSAGSRDPKTVNLPWNAMSFVLGDQRYTAVYLDHPANPKEARYSERDYGRFGSYFEYTVEENRPLEVKYRVVLRQGELTVEEAQQLHTDFVHPVEVEVSQP